MPWCDALSRPVAHSASSWTAHGYTLVTTQEQWKSHASVVEDEASTVYEQHEACAPSWRPSALLANSSFCLRKFRKWRETD